MAKTSTHIETDNAFDIVDNWNQSINSFDANKPLIFSSSSDGFYRLKDAGFSPDTLYQYDNNVNKLIESLRNYYSIINDYVNSMNDADMDIESKIPQNKKVLDTVKSSTQINVDNKIHEISSSRMDELKKESEILKNKQIQKANELHINSETINKQNLININKDLGKSVEFNDSKYKNKITNLQGVKTTNQSMINDFNSQYSNVTNESIKEMNNNHNMSVVNMDDSRFNKITGTNITKGAFSKFHNSNINQLNNIIKGKTGSGYTTSPPKSVINNKVSILSSIKNNSFGKME